LTPYLDRKPHALSGGQRQRVALGRAIVRNPKVFLLDEPLSNLDAALRVSTRSELVKQQRNLGTTMIYVTHDQIEAMTMGHRICIMNKGRIAQVGSPLEVYRYPADTFVARFLGSPGMNLLPAGCTHENAQPVLRIGNNSIPLDTLSIAPALAADSDVILGIRPEDLYEYPERAQGRPTAALRASVNIVEPLGADTLLLLALDGTPHEIVARVGRDSTARNGDTLDIHLDISALRLFDPHNEKALAVPAEA
ncbi:MAG: ATP-binding cassette domain-containing protein, partial [Candidatus Competibacteraceae bacterium]|nr:ATP-binding cassette domain-containing protein [Candidatus Competibacteraceae bacterium]